MERIGEIIPSVLKEISSGYKKKKQRINLQDIKSVWEELTPFFRKGEPKNFRKDILTIKTDNSSLLFSFSLQKERLIKELKDKRIPVKEIKFKIG